MPRLYGGRRLHGKMPVLFRATDLRRWDRHVAMRLRGSVLHASCVQTMRRSHLDWFPLKSHCAAPEMCRHCGLLRPKFSTADMQAMDAGSEIKQKNIV